MKKSKALYFKKIGKFFLRFLGGIEYLCLVCIEQGGGIRMEEGQGGGGLFISIIILIIA